LIVFGCQYQCSWLPGKTRLQDDLLCVEWNIKPYTLTHSLTRGHALISHQGFAPEPHSKCTRYPWSVVYIFQPWIEPMTVDGRLWQHGW